MTTHHNHLHYRRRLRLELNSVTHRSLKLVDTSVSSSENTVSALSWLCAMGTTVIGRHLHLKYHTVKSIGLHLCSFIYPPLRLPIYLYVYTLSVCLSVYLSVCTDTTVQANVARCLNLVCKHLVGVRGWGSGLSKRRFLHNISTQKTQTRVHAPREIQTQHPNG